MQQEITIFLLKMLRIHWDGLFVAWGDNAIVNIKYNATTSVIARSKFHA